MRELTIGTTTLPVIASPIAQFFYRQEFGSDMTADYLSVMSGFISAIPGTEGKTLAELRQGPVNVEDVTMASLVGASLDGLGVLQLVWAMAKAGGGYPNLHWPNFETWLASLEDADVFDEDFLVAAMEVAADGLFRGTGNKGVPRP